MTTEAAYSMGRRARTPGASPHALMPASVATVKRLRDAYCRGWYDADYDDAPTDRL